MSASLSGLYETNELVVADRVCCGRLIDWMRNVEPFIGFYRWFSPGRDECAALITLMHSENKRGVQRKGERRELWHWGHVAAFAGRPV